MLIRSLNLSHLKALTIILLIFYAFSFIFRTDNSFDQDLGRHIKLGEIILQTGSVPKTNLFSYIYPNFPFVNHHFLFEIYAYLITKYFGLTVLLILKILTILITFFLILKSIDKKYYASVLPIGFLVLHTFRERVEIRPEIFSYLFTSLIIYILEKNENKSTRLIYLIPVIQLIWVNTHIYFPIGFIVLGIYLLQYFYLQDLKKIQKILSIITISIFTSLINPNFIKGLFYPLTIFNNYGYQIVENQTMFFLENLGFKDPNFIFVKLSIVLIFLILVIGYFKKTLTLKNALFILSGITFALLNVRSFPYLFLLAFIPTIKTLGAFKLDLKIISIFLITSVILLYESINYLNGNYYLYLLSDRKPEIAFNLHGEKALDFFISNNLSGPIFNNFDIGSFISYRLYPKERIFVDGRPEAYPKEFFSEIYIPSQSNFNNFIELDKKINFKSIIFSYTDQTPWSQQFLKDVVNNETWSTVFIDDYMIVLIKTTELGNLKEIQLNELNPEDFQFKDSIQYLRVAMFLQNLGYTDRVNKFMEASLRIFPNSPVINKNSQIWW